MENINLIPLSSALIVGTLLFSYLNISSDSHIKIKLKCLGEKKFIFFLIIFVFGAFVSSIVDIIPGPPFLFFGKPFTWNIISFVSFVLFLIYSYYLVTKNLVYKKGKEKVYFDYIKECINKNIPIGKYIDSVCISLNALITNSSSDQPLNKTNKEIEPYAYNTISLLSARFFSRFIVENDEEAVEKILNVYQTSSKKYKNELLLKAIIQEMVLDEESLLRKKGYNNGKYEFSKWISSSLVEKYDILSYFNTKIKLFDCEDLKIYENMYNHILKLQSESGNLQFGLFSNIDSINVSLIEKSTKAELLIINEIFSKLLEVCAKANWNFLCVDNRDFSLRRFVGYFDEMFIKFKEDDYLMHENLRDVWEKLKEYQNTQYVNDLVNILVKMDRITSENASSIKIFLMMEYGKKDFTFFDTCVLPFIKERFEKGDEREKELLRKNIPYGIKIDEIIKKEKLDC